MLISTNVNKCNKNAQIKILCYMLYVGCIKFIEVEEVCDTCLQINKAQEKCTTTIGRFTTSTNRVNVHFR